MTTTSERLALIISADTKGAVRGLNEVGRTSRTQLGGAQSSIKQFTDSFRQSIPYVAAGTTAIVAGLVDAGQAAGQLSATSGALDSVFGTMGGRMREFAADAERLGLSQLDASRYAALLGGQLSNVGFSASDAAAQATTLVERAADLSVGFGSTGEAVNAISAVLRGEYDTIERFAVQLKQSDINARVAAKGLDGLTGVELKNAQATAALELLYEQSAARVGQWGSESNKAAREQQELAAKLSNLKAELGQGVLPALNAVVGGLNDAIEVGRAFSGVIAAMAESAADAVPSLDQLWSGLPGFVQGAGQFLAREGGLFADFFGPSESDIELLPPEEWERIKQLRTEAGLAAAEWLGLDGAITAVAESLGSVADQRDPVSGALQEYTTLFGELFGYQDALRGIDEGSQRAAQAHRAHSDAMRDAADAAADVRQAQLDVAEAAIIAFDAMDAAREGISDYADAQRGAVDPVFAMIRALEKQEELLEQAQNPVERSRQNATTEGQGVTKRTTTGKSSLTANDVPTLLDFAENASDVEQATIGLAAAIRTGETSIEQVRASMRKWVQQGLLTEDQAAQLSAQFEEVAARAVRLEGATVDQAAAAGIAAERLEQEAEAAERVRDAQERLKGAQDRLISAQERVRDTADDLSQAHNDAARKAEALDRAMFDLNKAVNENPQLIGASLRKLDEWVQRGLIPAEEKARIVRDMLQGINDAVRMFGGSKQLHIEVTSNALDFLNYLSTNPTITAGSIALRDRLAGQYGGYSGATGGRIPGPMGQPRLITAHGGEVLSSNVDLARFAQAIPKQSGGPLVVVEKLVAPDVVSGIRESMSEAKAAAYRAGLG